MKKKIFFLGFLVCVFVTLLALPTSAAVTLPDVSEGCDACIPTWFQIDRANHCDSQCVCSWGECPQCGKNTVLIYCNRTHMMSHQNWNSDKVVGHAYDQTSKCSKCGVTKTVVAVYRGMNCSTNFADSDTVPPTCISYGYTAVSCTKGHTDCRVALGMASASHWNFTEPISEHDIDFSRTVAPTCSTPGYDEYKCSNCSMIGKLNVVEPSGHISAGDDVTVEATCTERAYHQYTCLHCNEVIKEYSGELLEHDYTAESTKKSTCYEEGYTTYICENCSTTKKVTIPKTEHSYYIDFFEKTSTDSDGHTYLNGTFDFYNRCYNCTDKILLTDVCTNFSMSIYSCNCGMSYRDTAWEGFEYSRGGAGYKVYENKCFDCDVSCEFTIWNEHNYTNVVRNGEIYSVCENCEKETYVGVFDPDIDDGDPSCNHDYVSVFYPQNCVDHGYFMFICSKCGDGYIDRYVDPLGHIPKGTTVEPTCTAEGYTEYICARSGCGETWVDDRTPPLGHNYINGFCTRCGKSDICVHIYLEHVVPPTCHDLGYTLYTCTQCGDSYMDNYVKRLEHKWKTMSKKSPTCDSYGYNELSCTLCGEAETERINPYGHKWVAKSTALREDNTADVTYRCSTCNALKVENLQSAAAQAQNWLVTSIRGVFGGVIDCYNILANGISIGGVTLGEVVTAGAIVIVLVGVVAICIKIAG